MSKLSIATSTPAKAARPACKGFGIFSHCKPLNAAAWFLSSSLIPLLIVGTLLLSTSPGWGSGSDTVFLRQKDFKISSALDVIDRYPGLFELVESVFPVFFIAKVGLKDYENIAEQVEADRDVKVIFEDYGVVTFRHEPRLDLILGRNSKHDVIILKY